METGAIKYTHESETVKTDLNDSRGVSPVNPSSGSSTSPPESIKSNDYFRSRIWMVAAITLFVVSVALFVCLVFKESNQQFPTSSRVAGRVVQPQPSEKEILAAFGHFFRTEEEQRIFEDQIIEMNRNKTRAPVDTIDTPWNCSFERFDQFGRLNPFEEQWTQNRIVDTVNHACCISNATYITPDNATSFTGEFVILVRTKHKRQYFPYETCSQVDGCDACTCGKRDTHTTAVIYNDTEPRSVGVSYIKLDGCCKCINK